MADTAAFARADARAFAVTDAASYAPGFRRHFSPHINASDVQLVEAKYLLNSPQISRYRLIRSKHPFVAHAFRHLHRHVNPSRLAAVGHDRLFDRDERSELSHQPIFQA